MRYLECGLLELSRMTELPASRGQRAPIGKLRYAVLTICRNDNERKASQQRRMRMTPSKRRREPLWRNSVTMICACTCSQNHTESANACRTASHERVGLVLQTGSRVFTRRTEPIRYLPLKYCGAAYLLSDDMCTSCPCGSHRCRKSCLSACISSWEARLLRGCCSGHGRPIWSSG